MKKSLSKDQKKGSTDRFGYEWHKFNQIIGDYERQFLRWIFPLEKKDFKGKKILDAGCGIGRNSYWPLKYGAKEAVAFDYDMRTTKVAQNNLASFKNATVHYASIYDLPYKNEFDIAFSIGVIHHLEDPEKAVKSMVSTVKKNGKILIWVYGYEGNKFLVNTVINPLRKITSNLPITFTNAFAYCLSFPLYTYLKIIPQRKAYLKLISTFKYWHLHSIVLDQLLPKIANYWTKDEAKQLLQGKGLKDIQIHNVNDVSWTVIGTKR